MSSQIHFTCRDKWLRYTVVLVILMVSICVLSTFSFAAKQPTKPKVLPLPKGNIQRIAFGSCAKHWQPQPIWDAIVGSKPDLWLFLGDAIYADTDGTTAWLVSKKQLAGEWNRLGDKPEFQKARSKVPMMATWDNHDYGSHAGGVEFEVKEDSQKIFLDFFGEPENSERRKSPGIYDAKIFGEKGQRVQVILLDTKYFKDPYKKNPLTKEERLKSGKVGGYIPDAAPAKTLLGTEQWRWLEKQLLKASELRLIASSIQVLPDEKGKDEWGNFPLERQKLIDLISSTKATGVILLSGNVHFAELSKLEREEYPLYELTSSGMTHTNELYSKAPNRYRVKGPYVDTHFGVIEIDWSAKPSPSIELQTHSESGEIVFSEELYLDDLK